MVAATEEAVTPAVTANLPAPKAIKPQGEVDGNVLEVQAAPSGEVAATVPLYPTATKLLLP